MKKNILAAVMSIALAASMLAGCGSSNTTSTSTAETKAEENTEADTTADDKSAKDLKEVNVVLDWYPNALHTFIYTAIEKGYYEEEGLKVNIQFPSNANDALSLVAAGKAEIGLYYQHDIIQAVANQGIKVKSIGAVVQAAVDAADGGAACAGLFENVIVNEAFIEELCDLEALLHCLHFGDGTQIRKKIVALLRSFQRQNRAVQITARV